MFSKCVIRWTDTLVLSDGQIPLCYQMDTYPCVIRWTDTLVLSDGQIPLQKGSS